MSQLEIVKIGNKSYFLDLRLKQMRNINNPHDFKSLCADCNETEDSCKFFCDPYNVDGDCLMMK